MRSYLFTMIFIPSLGLVACGPRAQHSLSKPSISQPLPLGDAPAIVGQSTVALFIDGSKPVCTGTLLEGGYVLSADHCFRDLTTDASRLTVVRGPDALNPLGSAKGVGKIILHTKSDLALFKLANPLAGGVETKVLPAESRFSPGDEGVIAGYGKLASDVPHFGTLRWGRTRFQEWLPEAKVGRRVLRSLLKFKTGSSVCSGDSGGPLYREWNGVWGVAAVATGGPKKCGEEAVFSDPRANADWLRNAKAELATGSTPPQGPVRPADSDNAAGSEICLNKFADVTSDLSVRGTGGLTQGWFPEPGGIISLGMGFTLAAPSSAPFLWKGDFTLVSTSTGWKLSYGEAFRDFRISNCQTTALRDGHIYNLHGVSGSPATSEIVFSVKNSEAPRLQNIRLDIATKRIFWLLSF